MSHSQFRCIELILRHAWLNLWDKHMTTGRINQVATNHKKWKQLCSGNRFDVRSLCVWNFDCVLASVSQLSCTTAPLRRQHLAFRAKRRQKNGLFSTSAVIITALSGARNFCCLDGWSNHWSIQLQREYRSSRVGWRSIRWKSKRRKANHWFANQAFARCHLEAENCI